MNEVGANKAQIEQAAGKMSQMFNIAGIKIDDTVDNIEPMRKLEIKFHELYEQLNIVVNRSPEDYKNIQGILKELKQKRDAQATEMQTAKIAQIEEEKKDKLRLKNEKKKNMIQKTGRRDAERSMKPHFNTCVVEKPIINEDELNFLTYLGIPYTPEMRAAQAAIDEKAAVV